MTLGSAVDTLLRSLASFRGDKSADFSIVCGSRSWEVHGLLLGVHSDVLRAACSGDFKEARENKIDLSAHDAACLDNFVTYLYQLNYNAEKITTDIHMFLLADQYNISPLKELAFNYFKTKAAFWDSDFMTREEHGISEVVSLAYEAYDITKEIRITIIDKVLDCKILSVDPIPDELNEAIAAYADFAVDLVRSAEARRCAPKAEKVQYRNNQQCCLNPILTPVAPHGQRWCHGCFRWVW